MNKRLLRLAACAMLLILSIGRAYAEEDRYYPLLFPGGSALVDAEGKDIVPFGVYDAIYELSALPEGKKLYVAARDEAGPYALLDAAGAEITGFEYQSFSWEHGVVIFSAGGQEGVMDERGNILVEPVYTRISACGDGGFLALKGDPYDDSPDGVFRVEADGTERACGVKIRMGLDTFSHGLTAAISQETGLYGCLNAQGEWAVAPEYEWVGVSEGEYIPAAAEAGVGLLNGSGEWLVQPAYDYIVCEGEKLILAGQREEMHVISPEDYSVLRKYADGGAYGYLMDGGRALIVSEEGVSVIDERGEDRLFIEGALHASVWSGAGERFAVGMGEYGTNSAYLYRTDGTQAAGPYQSVSFLGEENGETFYMAVSFETESGQDGGYTFRDEKEGTRVCSLIDEEGTLLAGYRAEGIVWLGDGLILVQEETGACLSNLNGEIIRRFDIPAAEEEEAAGE